MDNHQQTDTEVSASKITVPVSRRTAPSDGDVRTEICEIHGEYRSTYSRWVGRWTECMRCVEDEQKRQDERDRQIRRAERRQKMLSNAKIPPRFSDATLANFVAHCDGAKHALVVAKDYADNFIETALESGTCLIFCGGVGAGKTHMAVGIAHAVIDQDKSVLFTSVINAVRAVKETYTRNLDKTEAEVIKSFISPALLILDEVGVQFGSDTEKMILFEIVNGRYERYLPTILISNLAKDALEQFIGERAIDRLREGGGKLVVFDWQSYRKLARPGC